MFLVQRYFMLSTSVFLLLAVLIPSDNVQAGTFIAFSPKDYSRDVGQPETVTDLFSVYNPNTSYTIHIYNRGNSGQFEKIVSSAVIKINDIIIVGPEDFNQNIGFIERPIILEKNNELSIELRSGPRSGLTVEIIGVDNEPPGISTIITPPRNANGWNNSDVTVEFVCSDSISGVSFCPAPVLVQTEGSDQVISGKAIDYAGNEASTSVIIDLDKTSPVVTITNPLPDEILQTTPVNVSGTLFDNLSGIDSVTFNGSLFTEGSHTTGSFSTDMPLDTGGNSIDMTVIDSAGNIGNISMNITYTPEAAEVPFEIIQKFAPQLRFDRGIGNNPGSTQYPMSAQDYFLKMCVDPDSCEAGYAPENYGNQSTDFENLSSTYWQLVSCGKQIRIVYWWFYGLQSNCDCCSGSHPGDWENIMIILSEDTTQVAAVTYFQHGKWYTKFQGNGNLLLTDNTGKNTLNETATLIDNTHPVVFVGRVNHGSYNNTYSGWQTCGYWADRRDGKGPTMNCWRSPLVQLKLGEEYWMEYSLDEPSFKWGRYGGDGGVSTQPYKDRDRFKDNCDTWDACNQEGCNWYHHEPLVGYGWVDDDYGWSFLCGDRSNDSIYWNFDIPTTDTGLIYQHPSCSSSLSGAPIDIQSNKSDIPEKFEITQNYPNPFNPTTTFSYSIPTGSNVTIEILNVLGQRVRTLLNEYKSAGVYQINWDGDNSNGRKVSSGIYFYRFQTGDISETKKMLLFK